MIIVLFRHEKKGNPVIWNDMDGPWGHYAKWDKSGIVVQIYIINYACIRAKLLQSCLTLCSSMDCIPPGSSVHGFFCRREYWSGLTRLPPGDLPNPGIELTSLKSPALAGGFFTTGFTWEVHHVKSWAGWITSWNQDCQEKYQQPQICRWHHSKDRKWRGTKKPLDEGEKGEWKSWLKTHHS